MEGGWGELANADVFCCYRRVVDRQRLRPRRLASWPHCLDLLGPVGVGLREEWKGDGMKWFDRLRLIFIGAFLCSVWLRAGWELGLISSCLVVVDEFATEGWWK